MNIKNYLLETYFKEQHRWVHWFPVGMILGSSVYFSLLNEPDNYFLGLIFLVFLLSLYFRKNPLLHFLMYQIWGATICFLIAFFKTNLLSTPMINENMKNVELSGSVNSIEYNQYKNEPTIKVTLENVKLNNFNLNAKIRLNLPEEHATDLDLNDYISVNADVYQFPMPCSLHGYFARRAAYLDKVAGSAKFLEFNQHITFPESGFSKFRQSITKLLLSKMHKPYGAVAAALVTADKSYIPNELRQNFADAGLAHVLVISGLHLSLIAGLIFFLIRRLLCIYYPVAVRVPAKKIAAVLTIFASGFYMALANFGVPVQRSFIMISLIMFAICINRTAFSMRSLVIACVFVLLISPDMVLSASFQLSFAAVLGLLAFYENLWGSICDRFFNNFKNLALKKIILGVLGIFATTFVASLATTPFSIVFFQRFSLVAVLGNLMAIPFVGIFVMPLGLLSVVSVAFGGWSFAFYLWEFSLEILCKIAIWTASIPGSAILVKAVPNSAVMVFFYGFMWLCLWKKMWRFLGVIPIIISIIIWQKYDPPFIYIDSQPSVIAVNNNDEVFILGNKNNTFNTKIWLQEWGKQSFEFIDSGYLYLIDKKIILINSPKEGIDYILEGDENFDFVITFGFSKTLERYGINPKLVVDRNLIKQHKGVAVTKDLKVIYLKEYFGNRPWCC